MHFLNLNATNTLVPILFGFAIILWVFFLIFTTSFSVGETLHHVHVAYKKYKIKIKFPFFVNAIYIPSCELKTSEFSLMLHTRENSVVFNTLDAIYLVFTSKK